MVNTIPAEHQKVSMLTLAEIQDFHCQWLLHCNYCAQELELGI